MYYYVANLLSCPAPTTADTCCTHKYGQVVLALQWMPGFGPNDEFTVHGKFTNSSQSNVQAVC